MSVLIDTSLGEVVVDLYVEDCPLTTKNFLKLCKIKYYNDVLFYNVQPNFIIQTGDPTGTGQGGSSVYGILYGEQAKYFEDEFRPHLKHNKKGLLSMASQGQNMNGSQFLITARDTDLEFMDEKHTIFGEVAEGMDVIDKINELFIDDSGRPYQDVRIKHTYILDDPFDDPPQLEVPDQSPERRKPPEETVEERLTEEELKDENEGRTEEEIERSLKQKEAKSRAVVLEMVGDLPDADVAPPEDVLFVCKLNPVTTDEDLELIFSRFGDVRKAEIIRDFKTGDSLCYAFIEFASKESAVEAYFKMNNVLIDDRRIKVDFSQSVAKLWNKFARRPWEKHSKEDQDPYEMEKKSKNSRDLGGNLFLKKGKGTERGTSGRYGLVGEDDYAPTSKHRQQYSRNGRDKDREREKDRKDRDTMEMKERKERKRRRHTSSSDDEDREDRRRPESGKYRDEHRERRTDRREEARGKLDTHRNEPRRDRDRDGERDRDRGGDGGGDKYERRDRNRESSRHERRDRSKERAGGRERGSDRRLERESDKKYTHHHRRSRSHERRKHKHRSKSPERRRR